MPFALTIWLWVLPFSFPPSQVRLWLGPGLVCGQFRFTVEPPRKRRALWRKPRAPPCAQLLGSRRNCARDGSAGSGGLAATQLFEAHVGQPRVRRPAHREGGYLFATVSVFHASAMDRFLRRIAGANPG